MTGTPWKRPPCAKASGTPGANSRSRSKEWIPRAQADEQRGVSAGHEETADAVRRKLGQGCTDIVLIRLPAGNCEKQSGLRQRAIGRAAFVRLESRQALQVTNLRFGHRMIAADKEDWSAGPVLWLFRRVGAGRYVAANACARPPEPTQSVRSSSDRTAATMAFRSSCGPCVAEDNPLSGRENMPKTLLKSRWRGGTEYVNRTAVLG